MREVTGMQFFTALDAHGIAPGDRATLYLGGTRQDFYPEQGEPVAFRSFLANEADPDLPPAFHYFLYEGTDND